MKKITLLGIIIVLIFGNCGPTTYEAETLPNEANLPPITTEGKRTAGCHYFYSSDIPLRKMFTNPSDSLWIQGGVLPGKSGWGSMAGPVDFNTNFIPTGSQYNTSDQMSFKGTMAYVNIYRELSLAVYNKQFVERVRYPVYSMNFYTYKRNLTNHWTGSFVFYSAFDSSNPPTVTFLKIDSKKRIVSGTFEGKLFISRADTTDFIQIKDGRFDFNY